MQESLFRQSKKPVVNISESQLKLLNIGLHTKRWWDLRRWMSGRWSERLRQLHWYQIPLPEALDLRGLLKVIRWNLWEYQADEISGNYGIVNLFSAPAPGEGYDRAAPTVWHGRTLKEEAWWDGPTEAKKALEDNFEAILDEFLRLRERMGAHPDDNSLTGGGRWKGAFLYQVRGLRDDQICDLCPRTAAVLDSLNLCKNFGFAMFSDLAPGSVFEAHTGSSNLRLRHHLGLVVPDDPNCIISVAGERRPWQVGKAMAFDDSYIHHVEQKADKSRAVLIVDVWHPDLNEQERETLSHPLFTQFGKGLGAREWEARIDHSLFRPLRLLKRHVQFFPAFFSDRGQQEVRKVLQELYETCDDFLRRVGARYFLDYGTLLGFHREGDIIKGDNDIDFGVFAEDFERIWESRSLLPPGFTLHDSSYRHGCPKLYVSYQGWEADFYCYQDTGEKLCWPTNSGYPCEREPIGKDIVLPLKTTNFLGRETWVPNQTEEYLNNRFHYTGTGAVRDQKTGYFYKKE